MKAVVLAGGEGIRLRPLTTDRAKALLPVLNRPLLDYVLHFLKSAGITEVILVVDFFSDQLTEYAENLDLDLSVHIHRLDQFRGTANILADLKAQLTDPFVVMPADVLLDFPLETMVAACQKDGTDLGMVIHPQLDRLGQIAFAYEGDQVIQVVPPQTQGAGYDTWVYYMTPRILELIDPGAPMSIHPSLVEKVLDSPCKHRLFFATGFWTVVGRLLPYLEANFCLLSSLKAPEVVSPDVHIPASATLVGPYFIDQGVRLGEHVKVGPNVILGPGVVLENDVHIDNAIVGAKTQIGKGSQLTACVVADHCHLNDGVRVDMFAVIGAHCTVGARTVIKNASRIGPAVTIDSDQVVASTVRTPHAAPQPPSDLPSLDAQICALMSQGGEWLLPALAEALNTPVDALEPALDRLMAHSWVIRHRFNPPLYTLTPRYYSDNK
ncbi:MAG: NDP-sugar synthase [Candidatus Margulisiibacteriota bacterium]